MEETDKCQECGEKWNSEYHMSDECVNLCEDQEVEGIEGGEK